MNNNNDTFADIVRELRDYAESLDYIDDYNPAPNAEPLRDIANRIEEIIARDTVPLSDGSSPIVRCAETRAPLARLDAEYAHHKNAAAIHEMLCEIQRMAHEGEGEHDLFRCQQWAANINTTASAALAAPARNCDKHKTADEAWDAWMHGPGCKREGEGFVGLLDWLYATEGGAQ